jgi:hypothetical protein
MKYMRAMLLGAALLGAGTNWAAAQSAVAVQWYQDRDDRQAFREGYRQGQWDARHERRPDWDDNRWREADDRRAYRDGYLRGYREIRGDGDRDDYYGRDRYTGYGVDSARRFGSQDGFNDGLRDRRTGHSFRPTHDDNFKHADRGYNRSFGSKSYYKQVYRESYEQGYDSGWRR